MDLIISEENLQRNILLNNYNNYYGYFLEYFTKYHDILKYMFFDPYKYKNINSIKIQNINDHERISTKLFSKIFVVSNVCDIKKIYQMKDKFIYFNLSFEFYFKDHLPELYMKYIDHETYLNFSDWCELYTYLNICEDIKKNNYKKTIVLCDDVIINTKFCDVLKYNKCIYGNWDSIIFDEKAFAINISTINVLIENIKNIIMSSKHFIFKDIFKNIKTFEITNIFLSQIKKNNILEYQKKQENEYREKINNLKEIITNKKENKEQNKEQINKEILTLNSQLDFLKIEKRNKRYIYEFNEDVYYLSLSYYNLLENNKKYYNYLLNKNIALIGPSPSIKKNKNGREIDNYDIVVKINNSIFSDEDKEYSGVKIDVLYTLSIAQNLNQILFDEKYETFQEYFFHLIQEKQVKFIVFSNELHSNIHNQWLSLAIYKFSEIYNINNIPIIFIPKPLIENHVLNCNKIPSAGYGAIMNLLQYDIKKLYIKGFTFFKDGHSSSYIGKEWKEKLETKSNEKIKKEINLNPENKQNLEEKIIHSLIKNDFCNISPHNFDYEYKSTLNYASKDKRIIFDESIKYLYEK